MTILSLILKALGMLLGTILYVGLLVIWIWFPETFDQLDIKDLIIYCLIILEISISTKTCTND